MAAKKKPQVSLRRPTAAAEAFVKGEAPAASAPAKPPDAPRIKKTLYLSPEVERGLAVAAVEDRREQSELVDEAVAEYLAKRKK